MVQESMEFSEATKGTVIMVVTYLKRVARILLYRKNLEDTLILVGSSKRYSKKNSTKGMHKNTRLASYYSFAYEKADPCVLCVIWQASTSKCPPSFGVPKRSTTPDWVLIAYNINE